MDLNEMENELMKLIHEHLEERNKLFREMLQECNGKTMDYESCRLLEKAFVFNGKNLVDSFIEAINCFKDKQNQAQSISK